VEDGEVQGQAELYGIAWGEWNLVCLFVSLEGFLLNFFKQTSFCVFSDVPVVVADHLDEECLCLALAITFVKNLGGNHVDNALAI